MTFTTPTEFSKESNNAFYAVAYKYNYDKDNLMLRELFNLAFYLGCQFAMSTSSELSPHIARFIEFTMWLTERKEPLEQLEIPY
jgi:hypothetical protein